MDTYHSRDMNQEEKNFQKELCYFEERKKTLFKVLAEQVVLWLFLLLLILVITEKYKPFQMNNYHRYGLLALIYLCAVFVGSSFRYLKERKDVELVEKQSGSIREEFDIGKVEACKFQVHKAFLLQEIEDEGPTYVLEVGENKLIVVCEHGKINNNEKIPSSIVEIIRLPKSKRVIATKWSGHRLKISGTMDKQLLEKSKHNWKEGDILSDVNEFSEPIH
jgi:hypothetical protein